MSSQTPTAQSGGIGCTLALFTLGGLLALWLVGWRILACLAVVGIAYSGGARLSRRILRRWPPGLDPVRADELADKAGACLCLAVVLAGAAWFGLHPLPPGPCLYPGADKYGDGPSLDYGAGPGGQTIIGP